MGGRREDRLHLRRLEWLALVAAMAAGGASPLGMLSGDAGRLLVTFLGLVSASILPTISLILGSMTASGRSVKAIDDLQSELTAANGCAAPSIRAGRRFGGWPSRSDYSNAIDHRSFAYTASALERSGQGIVVAAVALIVMRSGQIPGIPGAR